MNDYARIIYLSDGRRRGMVKILVAYMINEHGQAVKEVICRIYLPCVYYDLDSNVCVCMCVSVFVEQALLDGLKETMPKGSSPFSHTWRILGANWVMYVAVISCVLIQMSFACSMSVACITLVQQYITTLCL